ncbi:MAG: DUF2330 domain-containing protein [Fimbriiglobus sp.]|nr:DUF2330 domain-containing protein [Fimbriiglobus sp.]
MRSFLPLAVPLLLATVLVSFPRPAAGCAVAPPPNGSVGISGESALIVYDAATKTEHFIRTANFQSTSNDFGFLVPTPTKPELAEASADVFAALADLTKPRVEVRMRMKELDFGCVLMPMAKYSVDAAPMAGSAVRVVEQKKVGDFDAAVLQASDPAALTDWLTKNGYDTRPTLTDWFKRYIEQKWFLTAFKVAADSPGAGGNKMALTSSAVRISFSTDKPVYPYREPAEMQAMSGPRSLRLFVLSDSRVSGTVGGAAWAARTDWSNMVPAEKLAAAVSRGKLPESVGGRGWHLTEFTDPSSPRRGTDELYFEAAADQSAVERPPVIVWREYNPWPWVFGVGGLLTAVIVGVVVWRMTRVKSAG